MRGEVGKLASWIRTGEFITNTPRTRDEMHRPVSPLLMRRIPRAFALHLPKKARRCGIRGILLPRPAPKVAVKDTVGAGDAFMAGLMIGLTREIETSKVLENACRLGAFVASHYGATALLPNEIKALFK